MSHGSPAETPARERDPGRTGISGPGMAFPGPVGQLRLFLEGALLSYRGMFRWLTPINYLASKIVMPLASMIFFTLLGTYGGSREASFFIIGNAMQMAAVSGIYGVTMSIGGDRWDATLPYLFGSPANRLTVFFGRSFIHIIDGFLGVVISFIWGILLLGLRFSPACVPGLALAVLAVVFATSGLGLLMGCVALITRNIMFVNNTVFFLLLLLSGANIPLETMPAWMRAVSTSVPLTHGIAAARETIAAGGLTEHAGRLLLTETGIGAAYLLAGYLLFRVFERRAKVTGSLETM